MASLGVFFFLGGGGQEKPGLFSGLQSRCFGAVSGDLSRARCAEGTGTLAQVTEMTVKVFPSRLSQVWPVFSLFDRFKKSQTASRSTCLTLKKHPAQPFLGFGCFKIWKRRYRELLKAFKSKVYL